MSQEIDTVTVNILDRGYQVACPKEERSALEASARHLDNKMKEIRNSGKVIGVERIAVMAALNIAHEMLQTSPESESTSSTDSHQHIDRLLNKVNLALQNSRQLTLD